MEETFPVQPGSFGARVGSTPLRGRYRLTRTLKPGIDAETLLATDLITQAQVVVKAVRRPSTPPADGGILQEASALRSIDSPYLPALLDAGQQHGFDFLVASRFEGESLSERLSRGPVPPLAAARIGAALLRALQCVHEAGLIHRDVKADNIVVPTSAAGPAAVLVDFGLSTRVLGDDTELDTIAGTLSTMSPEQVARLGHGLDHRSDLFSAGVVLYESIAGVSPWGAGDARSIIDAIATRIPEPLRCPSRRVPRALEEIVFRLLKKDPEDRYHRASAAAADLEALAAELTAGQQEPDLVIGWSDVRSRLAEPGFRGRRRELTQLAEALQATRGLRGGVLLLEGESGSGKTRLLDEIESLALQDAFEVIRGGTATPGDTTPLSLLSAVVPAILTRAKDDKRFAAHLSASMQASAADLCRLAPQLASAFGDLPPASRKVEEHGESFVSSLACDLLLAIAPPGSFAVLLLDDMQWADHLSLRTLDQLAHRAAAGDDIGLLVVAAFRSEEVSESHPLRKLPLARDLVVGALGIDDLGAVLRSMAGEIPVTAVRQIVEVAGGNAFLATAMLYGLVESGGLEPGPRGWCLRDGALSQLQVSNRIGALLAARLAGLADESLRVFHAAAILGRTASVEAIARVAEEPIDAVAAALRAGRARGLGYLEPPDRTWVFAHDRVREALLGMLDDVAARGLHSRAALHLSERSTGASHEIASHFARSGDFARALPFALEAARHAQSVYAHDVAEHAYRIALQGCAEDSRLRSEVLDGLADALALMSRHEEAIGVYEELEQRRHDPVERARVRARIGEVFLRRGQGVEARRALETAIACLGAPVPTNVARAVRESAPVALRLVVGAVRTGAADDGLPVQRRALLRERCLAQRSLSYLAWIHQETAIAFWSATDRLRSAEAIGEGSELATALVGMGIALGSMPAPAIARRMLNRALGMLDSVHDELTRATVLHHAGVIHYVAGRQLEARPLLQQSIEPHRRAGDLWELGDATSHLAFCNYRLGELGQAVRLCHEVLRTCAANRIPVHSCLALEILSKASGGNIDEATLRGVRNHGDQGLLPRAALDKAEAILLLRKGSPSEAAALLDSTWREFERAPVRVEYMFSVLPWLATCCRLAHDSTPMSDRATRRQWLSRARRAATLALRHALVYPNHLPHTLRELALVAQGHGASPLARILIDRSVESADRLHARYELAQSLLARARMPAIRRWPTAADDERRAEALLVQQGAAMACGEPWHPPKRSVRPPPADTVALQARFRLVLEATRSIAAARDPDHVFVRCARTAREAVGAQRAVVVRRDPVRETWSVVASDGGDGYSLSLVQRALRSPGAVVSGADLPASLDPAESILLTGVRSCAAVAIAVPDDPGIVLHVASGNVGGAFGRRDENMLEMIASVAGTAFENARAHGKLQDDIEHLRETHEQLGAAREELRQANRLAVIGQLATSLAHELGQPIMLVRGHADRLQREARRHKRLHRDLEAVSCAARDMAQVVENVRRIASGADRPEVYDPAEAIAEALAMMTRRLSEARCAVHGTVRPDARRVVLGSRMRTQQAVLNFIGSVCDTLDESSEVAKRDLGVEVMSDPEDFVLVIRVPTGVVPEATGWPGDAGFALAQRLIRNEGGALRAIASEDGESRLELRIPLHRIESEVAS